MLKDKAGNRLFRKMTVKILFPDNIFPERTHVQHAGPKQGFGPEGVQAMLEQVADQLDTLYPWWDFTPIELKPEGRTTRWIFKFAGYRATLPASTQPIADSSTPEPETIEVPRKQGQSAKLENALQDLSSQELVQP